MSSPLPNPTSPAQGSFLSRLNDTRMRLKSLDGWVAPTGPAKPDEEGMPFVSVMLITFNHEHFLRQALDSILMQKRDFPIEINVIDDASTDGTQAIAREYSERFPDIVNCYFNPVNAGHIATQLNTIRGFRTLRGRYFALLEGDDYWTDEHKLERQVAYLEAHSDFAACAHQTLKVFDDGSRPPEHFLPFKTFGRNVAEIRDLVTMAGVFHLSSILYRNVFRQSPPACLYDNVSCEVTINMLYGTFGKFFCFDEYMSVYRVHGGGVFSGRSQEQHWRFHLHGFRRFALYLGPRYWTLFALAVRGFSRYVVRAPSTGIEVTSLRPSTWLLFLSHLLVAAVICLFRADAYRPYLLRATHACTSLVRHIHALRFRPPRLLLQPAGHRWSIRGLPGRSWSFVIRHSPDALVRLLYRAESCFPIVQAWRRRITYNGRPADRGA